MRRRHNNAILVLPLFALIILSIKIIGIDKIPYQFIVIILIMCIVIALNRAFRTKLIKKEKVLLIATMVSVSICALCVIVLLFLKNNYYQIFSIYKLEIRNILLISFFSMPVLIFLAIIESKKNNKI